MQKVEGSSPFSRSPQKARFCGPFVSIVAGGGQRAQVRRATWVRFRSAFTRDAQSERHRDGDPTRTHQDVISSEPTNSARSRRVHNVPPGSWLQSTPWPSTGTATSLPAGYHQRGRARGRQDHESAGPMGDRISAAEPSLRRRAKRLSDIKRPDSAFNDD